MTRSWSLEPAEYRGYRSINVQVTLKKAARVNLTVKRRVVPHYQIFHHVFHGKAFEQEIGNVIAHGIHDVNDLFIRATILSRSGIEVRIIRLYISLVSFLLHERLHEQHGVVNVIVAVPRIIGLEH